MRPSRGPLRRGLIPICVLLLAACSGTAVAAPVTIVRGSAPGADAVMEAPSAAAFVRYWRVHAFTPDFDARLPLTGGAWVHQHAFGLDADEAAAHPEWLLRDVHGSPLLIGSARYAADFGDAGFRAWWIARAQARLALGYRGLYVDDVLMERRTTTASGVARSPIDPRTGWTMSEGAWQSYMAQFMELVRASLPGDAEIVHDVLWHKGDGSAVLRRQLDAATHVAVRGAFNDPIVVGGSSRYGWQSLAGWVERQQARGLGVILDGSTGTAAGRLYGLAGALLVDAGATALANDAATAPGAFWSGYDVDLGAPTSARHWTGSVWRRDYAGGIVLVNEPGRATQTVALPAPYRDLDGVVGTSVTLPAASAAILVPVPAPPPPPQPPVSEAAPGPTAVSPPRRRRPRSGGGKNARIAGAAPAGSTRTSIAGGRTRVAGQVRGARGGFVRFVVERSRRGRWSAVVRARATVKKDGRFVEEYARLRGGRYRVRGTFTGTGTALPSRSDDRPFRVG